MTPEAIAFLMAVALIAGFVDAMAGGGGLLTVPALMAVGVPPVSAIATNKLQGAFGTGGAFIAFALKGHIDFRRFALPAFAALIGSCAGAFILTELDPSLLAGLIPILLVLMAVYFLTAPKFAEEDRKSRVGAAGLFFACMTIGAYDGFFGPGTGSFFTTALMALFGLGVVRAVAHAKLLNFTSNLAGLFVMAIGGHVLWIVGLAMAAASIIGGQLGARVAMRFGGRAVRPLLVIMSLALTAKLLSDPANPLTAALRSWWS